MQTSMSKLIGWVLLVDNLRVQKTMYQPDTNLVQGTRKHDISHCKAWKSKGKRHDACTRSFDLL